ncbi:MAG: hypothetical protein ACJ8AW_21315, partial [Rhodopila sp.]
GGGVVGRWWLPGLAGLLWSRPPHHGRDRRVMAATTEHGRDHRVMAGFMPTIHDFATISTASRGWPG